MNEPGKIHALTTPHDVDELLHLDLQLSAKLIHALRCPDCQDILVTRLLEPPLAPVPPVPDEAWRRRALHLRATALDHWLEPSPTVGATVEIPLLHALSMLEVSGDLHEAAATKAILGLFYTDHAPELAEKCLRSALLHSARLPHWLSAFSFASYELCLAQLGEVLPDLSPRLPAMEGDVWLRLVWIRMRARLTPNLAPADECDLRQCEESLEDLLHSFVSSGSLEEALLVAMDLAGSYSLRGRSDSIKLLQEALCGLAQELDPVELSLSSALEAFSSLTDRASYAAAAAAIANSIPSLHRYGERLLIESSQPLALSADAPLDLDCIRALLEVRPAEQALPAPAPPCRGDS